MYFVPSAKIGDAGDTSAAVMLCRDTLESWATARCCNGKREKMDTIDENNSHKPLNCFSPLPPFQQRFLLSRSSHSMSSSLEQQRSPTTEWEGIHHWFRRHKDRFQSRPPEKRERERENVFSSSFSAFNDPLSSHRDSRMVPSTVQRCRQEEGRSIRRRK